MKKLFFITVFLGCSLNSFARCSKCNDVGYTKEFVECYLCNGTKTVSPSYYGNAVGVTRWTVESSYVGGVKIGEWESEKKYKKYSFPPCQLCRKSRTQGFIHTVNECTCGKDLKNQNRQNYMRFKGMLRPFKIDIETKIPDDDFHWTKLLFESRNNWLLDSKNKEKILVQAASGKYDLEGANYGRERSTDK